MWKIKKKKKACLEAGLKSRRQFIAGEWGITEKLACAWCSFFFRLKEMILKTLKRN